MVRLSFGASDAMGEALWEEEVRKSMLMIEEEAEPEEFNLWKESKMLLQIALPAVAVQFSVLFIFPQTAAMVGTVLGTNELAGFSLGSLVGNLTCLSVMVGALTAADTLMPRAFSAERYTEVGRLAVRGFVMCAALLVVPVIPLCTVMEWIFDALGQDEYASHLASEWIKVYLIGVPGMLLFRVIQSFLNAQHTVMPLVYASVFACFVFHPWVPWLWSGHFLYPICNVRSASCIPLVQPRLQSRDVAWNLQTFYIGILESTSDADVFEFEYGWCSFAFGMHTLNLILP
jgi:hypothetical protein